MIVAICKVILDLLLIVFGLWGLALINPAVRFFIVGLSLMFVWGAMILISCFYFGSIGYAALMLTPTLVLIIYKIIQNKKQ